MHYKRSCGLLQRLAFRGNLRGLLSVVFGAPTVASRPYLQIGDSTFQAYNMPGLATGRPKF